MITLDGKSMTGRQAMHEELKRRLSLPEYYGGNLDALNDCLSERPERELVVIEDTGAFLEACGSAAVGLLRVFNDNGLQVLLD